LKNEFLLFYPIERLVCQFKNSKILKPTGDAQLYVSTKILKPTGDAQLCVSTKILQIVETHDCASPVRNKRCHKETL